MSRQGPELVIPWWKRSGGRAGLALAAARHFWRDLGHLAAPAAPKPLVTVCLEAVLSLRRPGNGRDWSARQHLRPQPRGGVSPGLESCWLAGRHPRCGKRMDSGTELLVRKTAVRRLIARAIGTLTAVAGIGLIASGQGLAATSTLTVTSVFSDTTASRHVEGVTYGPLWGAGSSPIATFTDSDGAAQPASDYNARVLWGDGSASTICPATDCTITAGTTAGTFNIAASHAFVDEKFSAATPSVGHTIHVVVNDKLDAVNTGATGSNAAASGLSVSDQPSGQSSPAFPGFSATAGTAFAGQIGSFQDGNQDAIATDVFITPKPEYTFSITWGDGTAVDTTSGTFTIDQVNCGSAPGTGTGQGCPIFINGTHTYAAAGTYTLSIAVKDGTAAAITVPSTATVTGGGTRCTSATLSPSPANQPAGSTVAFTATATGCTAQFEYWLQALDGHWYMMQAFSGTSTWSWNSAGFPPGVYTVHVWANQVPSGTWEAYASSTLTLTGCPSATLLPSSGSVPVGTPVTFTATAPSCTGAVFEFWIQTTGGKWYLMQSFSTTATWTWTNGAGWPKGLYTIHVWANTPNSYYGRNQMFASSTYHLT